MNFTRAAGFFLASIMTTTAVRAQTQCEIFTRLPVVDEKLVSADLERTERVINWLRQFTSLDQARRAATGFGFDLVDILSLDFSNDEEGWQKFRQFLETFSSRSFAEKQRYFQVTRTVNEAMARALQACLTQKGLHVWLESGANQREFALAAQFNSPGVPDRVEIFEVHTPSDYVCTGSLRFRQDRGVRRRIRIGGATVRESCTRPASDSASHQIVINAEVDPIGGGTLIVPAIPKLEVVAQFTFATRTVSGVLKEWVPPHTQGDTEYNGHGPDIIQTVRLELDPTRKRLFVRIFMRARETESDFTTAEGTSPLTPDFVIAEASPGGEIVSFSPNVEDHFNYTDTNHDAAVVSPPDVHACSNVVGPGFSERIRQAICRALAQAASNNGLVNQWVSVGDTGDENDAGSGTRVRVLLSPITIQERIRR